MQTRSVIAGSSLAQGGLISLPPRGAAAISPRRVVRGEQRGSQGVTQLEQLDASPPTSLPCCDGSEVSDVSMSEVPSKLCSVTADDTSMSSFLDRCCLRHSLMHGSNRVNPAPYRRRARGATRPRGEHRGSGLAATVRGGNRTRHTSPVGHGRQLRNRAAARSDAVSMSKGQCTLASPFNYSDTSFYSCASSASSTTASRRTASHESVASRTSKSVSHSAVSESVRSCSLTLTGVDAAARLGVTGRPTRALPSLRSMSTQPCSSSTGKLGATVEGLPCSVYSHEGGSSARALRETRPAQTTAGPETDGAGHFIGTLVATTKQGNEANTTHTQNTSRGNNNRKGGDDTKLKDSDKLDTCSGSKGSDQGGTAAVVPSAKPFDSAHGTASLHTPPALQVTQLCQQPQQSPLSGELSALYATAPTSNPTPPSNGTRRGKSGSAGRWRIAMSTTPSQDEADSPSMTRVLQHQQQQLQGGAGANSVVNPGETNCPVSLMPSVPDAVTTSETTTPTGDGSQGFDPTNVEKLDRIGRGSYGNVYVGIDRRTNRKVAIKELLVECDFTIDLEKQLTTLEREIVVMRKVQHPNTIRYLGAARSGNCLLIYMEYVSGGTLGARIKANGPYSDAEARNFTRQLLLGLEYLHGRNIVHRDLKGDNLFLTEDGVLKLGDFGTSKELVTSLVTDSIAGTPNFMAPEVIDCSGHSYEADIWSVGCCVLEMLTGAPPFSGLDNQMAVLYAVMKRHFENEIPKTLSAEAQDFIKVCTRAEPKERWTATQLLSHPWLRDAKPNEVTTPAPLVDSSRQATPKSQSQSPSSLQRQATDGAGRGSGGARSPALDAAILSCEADDVAKMTAPGVVPVAGKRLSLPPSVGEALMPSPETNGTTTSNDSSKVPTPVSRKKHGRRRHPRSRRATSRSINGSDMSQSSPKGVAMGERPFTDQTLTPIGPSVHFGSHDPVPPFTRSSAAFTRESGGGMGLLMLGSGGAGAGTGLGDSCTLHALSPSLSNGTPHLLMSHPLPSATQSPLLAPHAPFTDHVRNLVDSPDTWRKANTPHVTSLCSGAKERKKALIESAKSTPARNTTLVPLVPRKLGGALPSLAPPTANKSSKPRATPLHASLPI